MKTMDSELRMTQRPPRSCLRCTQRKVRCDKIIPCLQCRSRGLGAQCRVETVKIHGRTCTGSEANLTEPSYADLLDENEELKAQIARLSKRLSSPVASKTISISGNNEERLYQKLRREARVDRIWNTSQVLFPSKQLAHICLDHAMQWTWWLHGAVDPQKLQQEVDNFYSSSQASRVGSLLDPEQTAWLALFFSYIAVAILFMTPSEILRLPLPLNDPVQVMRNWYDSALFFLNEAQFLRILNVHNIQTIVVLGTCFINFGDFNLYYNLWGCALRIAQSMGFGPGHTSAADVGLNGQMCTRLWTALVTNDWLQIPLQAGHHGIDRLSAGLRFPEPIYPESEEPILVQPLHYQLCQAKLGSKLRYFYENLLTAGNNFSALESAVASADSDLAMIISQLPSYLQPNENASTESRDREEANPWLSWQRENLCILLLYYRLIIYRPLCRDENMDEAGREKASRVCLAAAHSILASIEEFDSGDPILHRRLVWSFLLPMFGAAATLRTSKNCACQCKTTTEHRDEISACLTWFDRAAERSHYAASAARFLREIDDTNARP